MTSKSEHAKRIRESLDALHGNGGIEPAIVCLENLLDEMEGNQRCPLRCNWILKEYDDDPGYSGHCYFAEIGTLWFHVRRRGTRPNDSRKGSRWIAEAHRHDDEGVDTAHDGMLWCEQAARNLMEESIASGAVPCTVDCLNGDEDISITTEVAIERGVTGLLIPIGQKYGTDPLLVDIEEGTKGFIRFVREGESGYWTFFKNGSFGGIGE